MKQRINVMVLATFALTRACLESLLRPENEINLTGFARSPSELVEKNWCSKTDVVVLCLMNDEVNYIETIPQLHLINPFLRFVILIEPDRKYDQMAALRMGVAGIVEMNQTSLVLIRAIKQVYEGDTWLSQKLITRLLDDDPSSKNRSETTYAKTDNLTKREYEIIDEILMGMSNKKISEKLIISEATVRHHLSSIYSKLYLDDRLNLVIYAYQNGLVQQRENLR